MKKFTNKKERIQHGSMAIIIRVQAEAEKFIFLCENLKKIKTNPLEVMNKNIGSK